jgi:hypothetical protein
MWRNQMLMKYGPTVKQIMLGYCVINYHLRLLKATLAVVRYRKIFINM